MFLDNAFPHILSVELYRPHPNYIAEMLVEAKVVWDPSKQPGDTVQLDRYNFWGDQGLTKDARERSKTETIGTTNGRDIEKDIVYIHLKEYTGPAASDNVSAPASFQIPLQKILFGQRVLWGQTALAPGQDRIQQFHDSIGSITLLDDYRRWRDRVFINELLKSTNIYNPGGVVADGGAYGSGETRNLSGRFATSDVQKVVEQLSVRNAPRFGDSTYRAIVHPRFMRHLQNDESFREVMRYPGMNHQLLGGLMYGQSQASGDQNGQIMPGGMPMAVVYEGVSFFVSNNLPLATVSIGFNASGAADTTAYLGLFFGPQSIGMAMGGEGARVLINQNDDFSRFLIAIWQLYAGWELLNEAFVTIARTYAD